ncbi:unnamed protein product [Closterium sp. Naga37s-1]|nr:unnamed protein product [Closterium sp. Naga37s-1]
MSWPLLIQALFINCPAPLPCPSALPLCPAPLPCPCALPLCPTPLPCPSALLLCPAPLPCPSALPLCPAPLPCPSALPLCPAPLPCPFALPLCPAPLPCPSALPLCPAPANEQVDIGEVKLLVDKLKLKLAQRYVENRADYGTPKSKHLHAFLEKHGSPDKREITIRGLDKQGTACTIKDILHENPIGKDKKTDLDSCIKLGQEFAQELIAKLDYRLGDLKHFDGAKLFMPMHYPPRPADREGWLNVHLYELLDMFKEKLPGVTYQECELEMELFAATMFKKFKDLTFQQALTNVLRTSDWGDDYPTLVHLWRALAVLPLSTVECERGFSRQNIIKSWDRTALSDVKLDQLMTVKMLDYPVEWVEVHKIFTAAKARKPSKRA